MIKYNVKKWQPLNPSDKKHIHLKTETKNKKMFALNISQQQRTK